HHRRSIRLKNYDYSQAGLYFVTIVTQNRECLFGDIVDDEIVLNDAGEMVEKWFFELENKFPDIRCQSMVVMPNHFHCIIQNVGADLCVCPDLRVCPDSGEHIQGEHIGSPLPVVVQWFKTMTTNEYIRGVKNKNWRRFDRKLWQRNYWEHIIRNEYEYQRIAQYILNNPKQWAMDKLNGGVGNQVMEEITEYGHEVWMI
ncbi:MAG TPA: hypothetical protein ENK06_04795, partial [Gammaproteobacteria bacterium]|nr:hypothetical protein [Gammaproteobacteria bacterium]